MPWGVDLWDRQDVLEHQTDSGIQFTTTVRNFAAKVAEIEKECALKLAALAKAHAPQQNAGPSLSFDRAWTSVVDSVASMAQARETSATAILADVCQPLKTVMKDKTQERVERLKEVASLHAELQKHAQTFDKAKKTYDKVEKDANGAKAAFEKLEASENAQKKKIEQARREYSAKALGLEDAERQLREDLDQFNRERTVIYYNSLPAVFDAIQALDENRAEAVVFHLNQLLLCLRQSCDSSAQAIISASGVCNDFNKGADSAAVADKYRTGNAQPGDIPFEEILKAAVPPATTPKKAERKRQSQQADTLQAPPQPEQQVHAQQTTPASHTGAAQVRMLYDFAGTNEGELPVSANETLYLINDDGSGWAHVSRNEHEQGYVPSTYYQLI